MENSSQICDINKPRPRHGHKYTKYKMRLSAVMLICIKQHLIIISSSIHEKVNQHRGWDEKNVLLIKGSVYV